MKEIENQVKQTEERGKRVIEYLDMYKGQNIYNEIALAIEFGCQLRLEEDKKVFSSEDVVKFLSKYSDNVPISHIIKLLTGTLK